MTVASNEPKFNTLVGMVSISQPANPGGRVRTGFASQPLCDVVQRGPASFSFSANRQYSRPKVRAPMVFGSGFFFLLHEKSPSPPLAENLGRHFFSPGYLSFPNHSLAPWGCSWNVQAGCDPAFFEIVPHANPLDTGPPGRWPPGGSGQSAFLPKGGPVGCRVNLNHPKKIPAP